ncbi:putative transcriptional regulator [Methanomicrobium sp. W14]|uniref:ArsR/SmtB family transcription factor n=1 Tax=Methanomicrobium sp. W14 TaxID=2817839 RepID=UPI001AE780DA|nr:winged helix-turn-helix domain-containing protein [Methanomicrobium sp. W14]MBP2132573.1 putative transcriptional regulator [Methanomicrobium sp. W14]
MTDNVILLEPGDERAIKIGKAMASQTANDILSLLKNGELTLTEISENLNQPLTTIKYHVENLLEAGLIEVKRIKYSEKGREVKVYSVCDQVVIVSAGGKDIRQILMKYASVFGLFIIATLVIAAVSSSLLSGSGYFETSQPQGGLSPQDSVQHDFGAENEDCQYFAATDVTANNNTTSSQKNISSEGSTKSAGAAFGTETVQNETFQEKMTPCEDENNLSNIILQNTKEREGFDENILLISFFAGGCAILLVLMAYESYIWRKEKKYWNNFKKRE